MTPSGHSRLLSRTFASSRRRFGLGLTLLAVTTSLGFAAPTAFSQSTQGLPGLVASFSPFERDARVLCAGRAEPRGTSAFLRTELYFGSNRPDAPAVTPQQFQDFLDGVITPLFPDGLTVLTGLGQFKGSSGVTERERSMVLILLYPVETAKTSGQSIEAIRKAYKERFQQESVLRADDPLPECVSF